MNKIVQKISKNNLAAGNILKENFLRMVALMHNSRGCGADRCNQTEEKKDTSVPWCPKKPTKCRVKPPPCPPKPCKPPRYDCPPNENEVCPYRPPKCIKPCIPGKKKPCCKKNPCIKKC